MFKSKPVVPSSLRCSRANTVRSAWRAAGLALGVAAAALLTSLPAQAFDRLFPPITKRGTLSMESYPDVSMNGKARRLSAGAWIRNENNTIDMPNSLRGRRFVVNYTENGMGEIDRVWILTAAEAARELPVPPKAEQLPEQ